MKGVNTTTSTLLYKHALMATWLEWWTVVASFNSASIWMGDPEFLRWCTGWEGPGLPVLQWWQWCCNEHTDTTFCPLR